MVIILNSENIPFYLSITYMYQEHIPDPVTLGYYRKAYAL